MSPRVDLSFLNPPQREAVRHTEGPLLVLAGAGSGKTRVITCRIAHLLEKRVPAESILAVTFTNKAAREMRERVEETTGSAGDDLTVSTFHSLCVRILRREIGRIGLRPTFAIYTGSDQVSVMRRVMRDRGIDARRNDAEAILWKISGWKNRLIPPGEAKGGLDEISKIAADLYPRYQAALRSCNALDFDDLIMTTAEIMAEHPAAREYWQDRFRYLMIDEYQDTNPTQFHLIRLLAERYRNLCVVGDDDQSIYGWRGADIATILDFEKHYPDCRTIRLEQNYRSTGNILSAANAVIRHNGQRKEKTLWTDAGNGEPIRLIVAEEDEEEASLVVERIQAAAYREGLSYGDFAILYRTNAQSRPFEEQLRFESIPYILVGGYRFFDRKEVKDTLSYLRVIANPDDEQALYRIVNFPRRGIGDGTLEKINAWSLENRCTLYRALGRIEEIPGIAAATKWAILEFHRLLEEERERFATGRRLADKTRELFARLQVEEELHRTAEDPAAGKRRVENVEQVVNGLAAWEARAKEPTLSEFLEKLSLLDEEDSDPKPGEERNAVVLMSLHSSKGLEFPHVFLTGMEEEILPHRRSIYEDCSIDEERRLCYVGITRARQSLTLTRCERRRKYGRLEERTPSRFLDEIPEELLTGEAKPATEEESKELAKSFFAKMEGLFED